jgi:hypothetical protein
MPSVRIAISDGACTRWSLLRISWSALTPRQGPSSTFAHTFFSHAPCISFCFCHACIRSTIFSSQTLPSQMKTFSDASGIAVTYSHLPVLMRSLLISSLRDPPVICGFCRRMQSLDIHYESVGVSSFCSPPSVVLC